MLILEVCVRVLENKEIMYACCRSLRILSNDPLVTAVRVDIPEKRLSKIWGPPLFIPSPGRYNRNRRNSAQMWRSAGSRIERGKSIRFVCYRKDVAGPESTNVLFFKIEKILLRIGASYVLNKIPIKACKSLMHFL